MAGLQKDTRVIAVSMPNRDLKEIADSKWSQWITSVTQLEKTTGYDFLAALPDSVEKALEANVGQWHRPQRSANIFFDYDGRCPANGSAIVGYDSSSPDSADKNGCHGQYSC